MIKNNIEIDVKVKCIEHEITQAQLAEIIGTTGHLCKSHHQKTGWRCE